MKPFYNSNNIKHQNKCSHDYFKISHIKYKECSIQPVALKFYNNEI